MIPVYPDSGFVPPLCFLMVFLYPVLALSSPSPESSWEKIREADGVSVYAKSIEDSELIAFKGVAILPADLSLILGVIRDKTTWTEWIEMFDHGSILESRGDYRAVVYQAFAMPFLIANRDLVMETSIRLTEDGESVAVTSHSVKHPDAPETTGVRINLRFSNWLLSPLPPLNEGPRTKASLEVHSNPGGYIPKWLTNYVQRFYVSDLFKRLRLFLLSERAKSVIPMSPPPSEFPESRDSVHK